VTDRTAVLLPAAVLVVTAATAPLPGLPRRRSRRRTGRRRRGLCRVPRPRGPALRPRPGGVRPGPGRASLEPFPETPHVDRQRPTAGAALPPRLEPCRRTGRRPAAVCRLGRP